MNSIINQLREQGKAFDVLYVEDDELLRTQTQTLLEKFFPKISIAIDGKDGLDKYRLKNYDIVITDINMPQMSGLEMAKEIKKLNKKAQIIIISAFNEQELFLQAIDIGVVQYLLKPIELQLLVATLLKTIQHIVLEKKITMLTQRVQDILNFQDNMIALFNKNTIITANKSFINFFSTQTVKTLKQNQKNIGLAFIKEDDYFSPKNPYLWLEELYEINEQINIKLYNTKTDKIDTFIAKLSKIPDKDEKILSLTDLSSILDKSANNTKELIFDKFIKIYNQVYMYNILKHELNKGVEFCGIMFRIDHYNEIYSTYGINIINTILSTVASEIKKIIDPTTLLGKWKNDNFLILTYTDSEKTKQLAQNIQDITKELSFEQLDKISISFGLTKKRIDDTISTFINRCEDYLFNGIQKSRSSIITDDDYKLDNEHHIVEEITKKFNTKTPIKIYTYHKGLAISSDAKIVDIVDNVVSAVLNKNQLSAINNENFVYGRIESLEYDIKAQVDSINWEKRIVKLKNFISAPSSPISREYLRLTPETPTTVVITKNNKEFGAMLGDISTQAISFLAHKNIQFEIEENIDLKFKLIINKNILTISSKAKIIKIDTIINGNGFKYIANINLDKHNEDLLSSYITNRQLEIIRELQKMGRAV